MLRADACPLCHEPGGEVLWQDAFCRLVLVPDADYPGSCRVIWKRHVAEMTDLDAGERGHLMSVVFAAEAAVRRAARPDKINLASLGNRVPHLHWHIVPRWRDDRHFPDSIWGQAARTASTRSGPDGETLRSAFVGALADVHGSN